jgi:hypothetical protein
VILAATQIHGRRRQPAARLAHYSRKPFFWAADHSYDRGRPQVVPCFPAHYDYGQYVHDLVESLHEDGLAKTYEQLAAANAHLELTQLRPGDELLIPQANG